MSSAETPSTSPPGEARRDRAAVRGIVATFVAGSAVQLWMIERAWVYFDQVLLLRLGLRLARDGELVSWGKVMSGGGAIPGCALELVVGLPLALWLDARSPLILLFVSQLAAGAILVRLLWRWVSVDVALWFAVVYWLSPWRLFHGGFLWEPHFLLLPAAAGLWAAFTLRHGVDEAGVLATPRARWLASLVLGATSVLAPQLHASGALLGCWALALGLRRRLRPVWSGLIAGGLLAATPLLTALRALVAGEQPPWAPTEGRLFSGLLEVHPLLKSLTLWIRIASAETGRRLLETTFLRDYAGAVEAPPPSPWVWLWMAPLVALAMASVALVAFASWRALRALRSEASAPADEPTRWLLDAAAVALVLLLAATALSPVSPQMRYVLVFLHLACLPVAVWLARWWPRAGPRWRALVLLVVLARLPMAVVLGLGHPMYRPPADGERALLSGAALERLELVPPPFGSGKERELPVGVDPR